MAKDIDVISDLLAAFFESKRVKQSLTRIHEVGISGWEKWWQTEFALYLSDHEDIAEWDMEHRFQKDRRTRLPQDVMALDIGFRIKRYKKNEWFFVELKQDDDARRCVDRMCKDAGKVFAARKRSTTDISIRYIACAGIFLHPGSDRQLDDLAAHARSKLADLDGQDDGIWIYDIGKHHVLMVF